MDKKKKTQIDRKVLSHCKKYEHFDKFFSTCD